MLGDFTGNCKENITCDLSSHKASNVDSLYMIWPLHEDRVVWYFGILFVLSEFWVLIEHGSRYDIYNQVLGLKYRLIVASVIHMAPVWIEFRYQHTGITIVLIPGIYFSSAEPYGLYRWFSARLQYPQCISNKPSIWYRQYNQYEAVTKNMAGGFWLSFLP